MEKMPSIQDMPPLEGVLRKLIFRPFPVFYVDIRTDFVYAM